MCAPTPPSAPNLLPPGFKVHPEGAPQHQGLGGAIMLFARAAAASRHFAATGGAQPGAGANDQKRALFTGSGISGGGGSGNTLMTGSTMLSRATLLGG